MPYNVKLVDENKGKNKNIKTPFGAISKKKKCKRKSKITFHKMPLSAKLDSVSVFCILCHSCGASKLKLKMILLQNSWCFLISSTHKSLSINNKRRKFNRNVVWLQSCVNNVLKTPAMGSHFHTFNALVVELLLKRLLSH